MSFIEMNGLDDVTEAKPIPEGEYTLVIADVKERNADDGSLKGLLIMHEVNGHPDAARVMHNLSLPLPGDDEEKKLNKLRFAKRYLVHFGIPFNNGIDCTKMMGKTAKCKLTVEEYEGQFSNKIKLPAMK